MVPSLCFPANMSLFGSTSGFGTGGTSMFGSTTTDNHNPMKVSPGHPQGTQPGSLCWGKGSSGGPWLASGLWGEAEEHWRTKLLRGRAGVLSTAAKPPRRARASQGQLASFSVALKAALEMPTVLCVPQESWGGGRTTRPDTCAGGSRLLQMVMVPSL